MPTYNRVLQLVEACRWSMNGEHPNDNCAIYKDSEGKYFRGEGNVVRYFRRPDVDGESLCVRCGIRMHEHGWIDQPRGNDYVVCPGDWIITARDGSYYPMPDRVFKKEYSVALDASKVEVTGCCFFGGGICYGEPVESFPSPIELLYDKDVKGGGDDRR